MALIEPQVAYVPIAKPKPGEFEGFGHLRHLLKGAVLPHFVLPSPLDWDHEDKRRLTLEECQGRFAQRLGKWWPRRPCIIDGRNLEGIETVDWHPIYGFVTEARRYGGLPTPTVTLEAQPNLISAIRASNSRYKTGVVIRLTITDFANGDLTRSVDRLLRQMAITAPDCGLCVDLGPVDLQSPGEMAELVLVAISALPPYRRVEIALHLSD